MIPSQTSIVIPRGWRYAYLASEIHPRLKFLIQGLCTQTISRLLSITLSALVIPRIKISELPHLIGDWDQVRKCFELAVVIMLYQCFLLDQLQNNGYYKELQSLIESTSSQNGNGPVVIVAHSLGALVSHYFLTELVSQQWKDKYISQYITMAAVWAGAVKVLHGVVSGETDGLFPFMANHMIRVNERSFPSEYWLVPRPIAGVWTEDQVLFSTPEQNYSAFDLPRLMRDLDSGGTSLQSMYSGVMAALDKGFPPPNVPTLCIAGTGIKTPDSYVYTEKFPNGSEQIHYGDGDGSVNINSVRSCRTWIGYQQYPVTYQELEGVEHVAMLSDQQTIKLLEKAIMK